MLDFNEMVIFVKVVETRNFTAAAKALGLPKSTISRKISQLETRLGARLLQRTTRSVHPTELGALYYDRCARLVAEAEEAELVVSQCQETPRGLPRVTMPVDIGIAIMPAIAGWFLTRYPEIHLEADVSDRYVDLVGEGFDMAVRAGSLADSTLVAHRFYSDRIRLCASPDYLARCPPPATPMELAEHDCIVFDFGQPRRSLQFTGPEGSVEVEMQGRLKVNNFNALRGACLAGQGIGLLPELLCRDQLASGDLLAVLDEWRLPEGGVYAVYPSPRHLTPKVRALIQFLDHHFRQLPH